MIQSLFSSEVSIYLAIKVFHNGRPSVLRPSCHNAMYYKFGHRFDIIRSHRPTGYETGLEWNHRSAYFTI